MLTINRRNYTGKAYMIGLASMVLCAVSAVTVMALGGSIEDDKAQVQVATKDMTSHKSKADEQAEFPEKDNDSVDGTSQYENDAYTVPTAAPVATTSPAPVKSTTPKPTPKPTPSQTPTPTPTLEPTPTPTAEPEVPVPDPVP